MVKFSLLFSLHEAEWEVLVGLSPNPRILQTRKFWPNLDLSEFLGKLRSAPKPKIGQEWTFKVAQWDGKNPNSNGYLEGRKVKVIGYPSSITEKVWDLFFRENSL